MFHLWFTTFVAVAAALVTTSAHADSAADEVAINQRLQGWTAAFNAKDSAGVCDLFAPDLVYSIAEVNQGSREALCANLDKLFARSDLQFHYANPDVHEIIVEGNLAVVRLTWTLTTQAGGVKDTMTEEGIDIFRRQPDGRWSIARFIAFTTRANKLLP